MQVLDIRELAQNWRDALEARESVGVDDYESDVDILAYEELCLELGIDADPDALEAYGDGYEPTMIPEQDFEEYAQELADDIGAFSTSQYSKYEAQRDGVNLSTVWPFTCIDWEHAARELAMDYTPVRFDGTDYYIRSV
jgi:hypothetical protein